jgi:hypothetical protein
MSDTSKPTSYFQVQREREQQLEMDALVDGHSALMLQAQRLANQRGPQYPQQPNHPFAIDAPTEPPLGISVDRVPDVSKVNP